VLPYNNLISRETLMTTETKNFTNQAGGHIGTFIQAEKGKIMKKVGKNEFTFYSEQLAKHSDVQPLAPKSFGIQSKDGLNYVVLEDLTYGYDQPCILDVKMGTSSVGEDATAEKKERMGKKDMSTTTHTLGIRITGMKVYQTGTKDFVALAKPWGRKVTENTMFESLRKYFDNGKAIRKELVSLFLEKLEAVRKYMESQKKLRFYSSSLLFIYDGIASNSKVDVRMIDFAHVHDIKDGGRDEGYITGLTNLIKYLKSML